MSSTKPKRRPNCPYSLAVADLHAIRPHIGVFDLLDGVDGTSQSHAADANLVEVVVQSADGRRVAAVPRCALQTFDSAWRAILRETGWSVRQPRSSRAWAAMVREAAGHSRRSGP